MTHTVNVCGLDSLIESHLLIAHSASPVLFKEIIEQITVCGNKRDYKILNQGSDALIGSNSKDNAGDLYIAERSYALFKPQNLRSKRVFDFMFSLLLVPLLPLNIFLVNNFGQFIWNWVSVFVGKKSWVGFSAAYKLKKFPSSKQGIL